MNDTLLHIKSLIKTLSEIQHEVTVQDSFHYNEILKHLDRVNFSVSDKSLDYDKIFKGLIIATIKTFIYERSEESRKALIELYTIVNSFEDRSS